MGRFFLCNTAGWLGEDDGGTILLQGGCIVRDVGMSRGKSCSDDTWVISKTGHRIGIYLIQSAVYCTRVSLGERRLELCSSVLRAQRMPNQCSGLFDETTNVWFVDIEINSEGCGHSECVLYNSLGSWCSGFGVNIVMLEEGKKSGADSDLIECN